MKKLRIAAVIPAAGLSSRMHGFKPLLTIGEKPLLEHVIMLFKGAGITDIIIVVGHRAEELIRFVEESSCQNVVNHSYRDGMFSSIQQGLKALRDPCDAIFSASCRYTTCSPCYYMATVGGLFQRTLTPS